MKKIIGILFKKFLVFGVIILFIGTTLTPISFSQTPISISIDIQGGFGLKIIIKNNNDFDIQDLEITINMDATLMISVGETSTTIDVPSGEEVIVTKVFIFGFGSFNVTVDAFNIRETRSGFIIGPFVFLKPEVKEIIDYDDCVDLHYIGRYASNNTIFDSSYNDTTNYSGGSPLNVFVTLDDSETSPLSGYNIVIEGFAEGLIGLEEDQTKIIGPIPPEKAYGLKPVIGDIIDLTDLIGITQIFKIVDIKEDVPMPEDLIPYFGAGNTDLYVLKEDWHYVGEVLDLTSIYLSWENCSVVTKINDTKLWMYTTPTTDIGEYFTWKYLDISTGSEITFPEEVSVITDMNENSIFVSHNPEINDIINVSYGGFYYMDYIIQSITEDTINASYTDPSTGDIQYMNFETEQEINRNQTQNITIELPKEYLEIILEQLRLSSDDFNLSLNKLAGESLIFEVEIINIYKTFQESQESDNNKIFYFKNIFSNDIQYDSFLGSIPLISEVPPLKMSDSEYPPKLFNGLNLNSEELINWFSTNWIFYFLNDIPDEFDYFKLFFPNPFRIVETYEYNGSEEILINGDFDFNLFLSSKIFSKINSNDKINVGLYSLDPNSLIPIPIKISNKTVDVNPGFMQNIGMYDIILENVNHTLDPGESLLFEIELIPGNKTIIDNLIADRPILERLVHRTIDLLYDIANRSDNPGLAEIIELIELINDIASEANITREDAGIILNSMISTSLVYDSINYPSSVSLPYVPSDVINVNVAYGGGNKVLLGEVPYDSGNNPADPPTTLMEWGNWSDIITIDVYGKTNEDRKNATVEINGCGLDLEFDRDDWVTEYGHYEFIISPRKGGILTVTVTNGSYTATEDINIEGLDADATTSIGDDKKITVDKNETIYFTTDTHYAEIHVLLYDQDWVYYDTLNTTIGNNTEGNGKDGVYEFYPDVDDMGYIIISAMEGYEDKRYYSYDVVEIIPNQ